MYKHIQNNTLLCDVLARVNVNNMLFFRHKQRLTCNNVILNSNKKPKKLENSQLLKKT